MPPGSFFLLERLIGLVFAPFFPPLLLMVAGCKGLKQYWRCHFAVVGQTIVNELIGLEMEKRMYCGQLGQQFNPNQITSDRAV